MNKLACLASGAIAACGLLAAVPAAAQPKSIALPCGQGVQVSSNGAALREVLQEMAGSLKFQLQYLSSENPPIRLEGRHGTLQLVQLLSNQANLAVRYRHDANCKGELRIASIWVLSPGGGAAAVRPPPPAAVIPPPAVAPAPAPTPTPVRASPPPNNGADSNEEYLRAHGLAPNND